MTAPAEMDAPAGLVDCTGYVLGRAGLLLLRAVDASLEPHGMQMHHVGVLMLLSAAQAPMSQQQLSRVLNRDPTRMVGIVDDLEQFGLVERLRDPHDRRRYSVTMTPRGHKTLREVTTIIDAAEEAFYAPLREDERTQLGDLVRRLMAPHWAKP